MHPNLIGTNETEKIATDVFGQALDVHSSDLFSWKHHINEYRRVIAPVKTETMVHSLTSGLPAYRICSWWTRSEIS